MANLCGLGLFGEEADALATAERAAMAAVKSRGGAAPLPLDFREGGCLEVVVDELDE